MAKIVLVVFFLVMFTCDIRALSVAELLLSTLSDKMAAFDKSLENINNRLDRLEKVIGTNEQVLDIGDNKEKQEIGKEKDAYSEMMKTSHVIKKTMSDEKHFIRSLIKDYSESFSELKHDVNNILSRTNRTMQESYERMIQLDIELTEHIDEKVATERHNILSELKVTQDRVTNIEKTQSASRINHNVEHQVAFFASLTPDLSNMRRFQNFYFDHVVTNLGNAYNEHQGTFVAPVAGTYVFSVTLLGHHSLTTWGHFLVNENIQAKFNLIKLMQVSQTIVVVLKPGDKVCVENTEPNKGIIGDRYSTFSGFLLYEDFATALVVG